MNIQIPFRCVNYTKNENMNKTCANQMRCIIYYDEFCEEYEEREYEKL